MNFGKLDRRITLQRRAYTRDGTGSKVETWTDSATVCAEYVSARGREALIAGADRADNNSAFRIRYREINSTDWRVVYHGDVYDITDVSEEGRRSSLLLTATSTQGIA